MDFQVWICIINLFYWSIEWCWSHCYSYFSDDMISLRVVCRAFLFHQKNTGRRLIGLSPGFRLPMDSLCVSWPYAHLPGHSDHWLSWQTTHLSRLSSVKVTREGWAREDHGVVLESLNMCCRVIIYAIKSFWNSNCMVSFQLPLFFRLEFRGLAESRSRYDRYLEILYDK